MTVGRRVRNGERRGTVVDQDDDRLRIIWDDGDSEWLSADSVEVVGG